MKKITHFTYPLIGILVIAGCTTYLPDENQIESTEHSIPVEEHKPQEKVDKIVETDIPLEDFFLPNHSKAHYIGEGNEFAELDIEVTTIDQQYVIIDENNGGVLLRKVYKIGKNRIDILSEQPIELEQPIPTVDELTELQPIGIYLQKPLEKGATFGDWTIVDLEANVDTPYQTFEDVIVIEMSEEDIINRKYFVQGFGEVKRESIMTMEEDQFFTVTSTLETVE